MKIVLLGYMGCGKSTVGKQLASTILYPFIDLDTYIETKEMQRVSNIFTTKGEIYFRKKESCILEELLNSSNSFVLALGGGTPCYGNVMQLLLKNSNTLTIYLNSPLDVLTQRLYLEKENRPLLSHISEKEILHDFIRKHLFERSFYYNQASKKVHTNNKSVQEIVEEIVAMLF